MTVKRGRWRRCLPVFGPLAGLAVAAAIAGCAVPRAMVDPAGRLDVLGPGPGFSIDTLSGEWAGAGAAGDEGPTFTTPESGGIRSLHVVSGAETGLIYRHTDAILPVAPYLSWAWNVGPHAGTEHPVRVLVGFRGGDPDGGSWGSRPWVWLGSELPPYDRLLTIGWDSSALRRGYLTPPRDNPRAPRHYTVRGGAENTGIWSLETVDLARIYGEAWPGDDPAKAKIVFIGLAALGGGPPAMADVSGLRLSR